MADGPGPASGGQTNPANAVNAGGFWPGFIAGGLGVFVSAAGLVLVVAFIIAVIASATRSPKAGQWWRGTGGVAVGFLVVRLLVLAMFQV